MRYAALPTAKQNPHMVKLSDDSPEAALILRQQSRRLCFLRRAMGLSREMAAAMAGVSRWTWRRMEDGVARIDTVPLRRFLAAYDREPNLPGEYVLSGSTAGLPPALIRNLLQLEQTEPESSTPPSSGSHVPPAIPIAGKHRHPGKARTDKPRSMADQEAA
jgi:DNA-binding XRE family transcriptional regulator